MQEGSTAVRRDVVHGQVWSATPNRVIADSGDTLMLACWPGTEMIAPTTWIDWLRGAGDEIRTQAVGNLAAGRWELGRWTWRDTTLLSRFTVGEHFSVHRYFPADANNGPENSRPENSGPQRRPPDWYVNFEVPLRRTPIGIDVCDLLVDLVVAPDLSSYRWKDEDEYAHGRRLGFIDEATHAQIELARERVLGLLQTRGGPFADDWSSWRRGQDWPVPVLPEGVLDQHRP